MRPAHKMKLLIIMAMMLFGDALALESFESFESYKTPIIPGAESFQPQQSAQPYVVATPSSGEAPFIATLQVIGMERTPFWLWELDWDGDGDVDTGGQGQPIVQVTYDQPGSFAPVFTFFDDGNHMIARAQGLITATGRALSRPMDVLLPAGKINANPSNRSDTNRTGSSSAALNAIPGGFGIISDRSSYGQSRPPIDMGDGSENWTAPKEEFTEDLKADLQVIPDRGSIPFIVRFDASGTYARYGVHSYNYDIAWGPDDAKDDGYYLYSGSNPLWNYTFKDYGMYLAILDVVDNAGNSARVTKVIFAYIGPEATLWANTTSGLAPLTVKFMAQPVIRSKGNEAVYAYWDFDLNDAEQPVGGVLSSFGSITHTYNKPGEYEAGLTLMDKYGNEGPRAKKKILVTKAR